MVQDFETIYDADGMHNAQKNNMFTQYFHGNAHEFTAEWKNAVHKTGAKSKDAIVQDICKDLFSTSKIISPELIAAVFGPQIPYNNVQTLVQIVKENFEGEELDYGDEDTTEQDRFIAHELVQYVNAQLNHHTPLTTDSHLSPHTPLTL